MKELSTEEKAKAYDGNYKAYTELINRLEDVKEAIKKHNYGIAMDILYNPYPGFQITTSTELKESEDEKIRKAAIEFVRKKNNSLNYCLISKEDVILGLKKQGDNKWKPSKDEMDALYGLAYITNKMDDKKDEAITKLYQDLKREFFNGVSYENMFPSSPVNAPIKLEKQGEQKPADKVEPKFKVGDWITDGNITIQIEAIKNNCYLYCEDCALYSTKTADKVYHLWTIKDAKDGDVLAVTMYPEGTWIGILKEHNGCTFSSYCFVNTEGTFKLGTYNHGNGKAIHPATKEQRDLLFAKMKEAGYEWDAEKKELKEIEQKQVIDYSDSLPKDNWELIREFIAKFGRIPKDEDELNVLVKYVLKRQKPTWSEEDERILSNINLYIRKAREFPHFGKENIEEADNWLKSLKDRVLLQSEKEWSEEDKKLWVHDDDIFLDAAKMIVEDSPRKSYGGVHKKEIVPWFYSLKERLKSLRPQNTWKPSDEQMEALANALSLAKNCGEESAFDLRTLYEQLKNFMKGE